jgi:hypothetical protein
MIYPNPIDKLNALDGARSDLTPRTYMQAAGSANLIVGAMVFVEFSVIALVKSEPETFGLGLWLVPFVTLVIWVAATVIYFLALASRALRALGRLLAGRSRSPPPARSGVWDDWLDGPDLHDR